MNIRQREGSVQVLQTVDVNEQIHARPVKAGVRAFKTKDRVERPWSIPTG